MADNDDLSTISCEPCRHKKRKCDRKLPACTLCNNCGTQCNYPERGKRGMPVGYIVRLEDRLAETETALFQVMANFECYRTNRDPYFPSEMGIYKATLEHYSGMTKSEKIAEWDKDDISVEFDAWNWWHHRNDEVVGLRLPITTPDLNAMSNRPAMSGTRQTQQSRSTHAMHQHTPASTTTPNTITDDAIPDRLKNLDRDKYF